MNTKYTAGFLKGVLKAVQNNYTHRRMDPEYIAFLAQSEENFLTHGKLQFETTFTEFGETFTTNYDVQGILSNVGAMHIEAAILQFQEQPDVQRFEKLINAYYYIILIQLLGVREQKLDKSLFIAEIALSLLLAILYFPQDVPLIAQYLRLYRQNNPELSLPIASRNAVDTHLLPLCTFAATQTDATALLPFDRIVSGTADFPFQTAIKQVYSADEKIVSLWVEQMADYHIAGSKDDQTLPFNNISWQFFPVEIVTLLVLRTRVGLSNRFVDHPLVKAFVPFLDTKITLSEKMNSLRQQVLSAAPFSND